MSPKADPRKKLVLQRACCNNYLLKMKESVESDSRDEFKLTARLDVLYEKRKIFNDIQEQLEGLDEEEISAPIKDSFEELFIELTATIKRHISNIKELEDQAAKLNTSVNITGVAAGNQNFNSAVAQLENANDQNLNTQIEEKQDNDKKDNSKDEEDSFKNTNEDQSVLKESSYCKENNSYNMKQENKVSAHLPGESHHHSLNLRLPQLNLPTFSNDPKDWTSFKSTFNSFVDSDPVLQKSQKFKYLLSCLRGTAKDLLHGLDITNENYNIAWTLLTKRFENKRLTIFNHMSAIHDLPKMKRENAPEMRHIIDTVIKHVKALEVIGQPINMWDTPIIFILTTKLDRTTLSLWEGTLKPSDIPSLNQMIDFLEQRFNSLSFLYPEQQLFSSAGSNSNRRQGNERSYNSHMLNTNTSPVNKSYFKNSNNQYNEKREDSRSCLLCNKSFHPAYRCTKFLSLPISERWKLIRQTKLCNNCLQVHSGECKSSGCRYCSKKHNSLLCNIQGNNSQHNYQTHSQVNNQQLNSQQSSQSNHHHFNSQPNGNSNQFQFNSNPNVQSNYYHSLNDSQTNFAHTSPPVSQQLSHTPPVSVPNHNNESYNCSATNIPKTSSCIMLGTARILIYDKYGNPHFCRALLDSGSQPNCMTPALAQRLKLDKVKTNCTVKGIGKSSLTCNYTVNTTIQSRCNSYVSFNLEFLIIPTLPQCLPKHKIDITNWKIPAGLFLADPDFNQPAAVEIIVGAEIYFSLLGSERINLSNGSRLPILQNTDLGWIVSGPYEENINHQNQSNPTTTATTMICLNAIQDLDYQLNRFWELESIPLTKKPLSQNEKFCEDHFAENTIRNEEGRFIVQLPVIEGRLSELGDSSGMAKRRFHNLERRLQTDSVLKEKYVGFMEEYKSLGHMESIQNYEVSAGPVYYLPHHAVHNPYSKTTSTRVVFDASAKTTTGVSLNNILLTGPTVQPEIFETLTRFRTYRYALSADMSKMFRQVLMDPRDSELQRIYWRSSPEEQLKIYRLKTVTYGTVPATYLATKCLQQLAHEDGHLYPNAKAALLEDYYIDDFLSGKNTVQELIALQSDMDALVKRGGFELRKWCSNSYLLNTQLKEKATDDPNFLISLDGDQGIKALGLWWHPTTDTLRFKVPDWEDANIITKRQVASDVAKLFDPMGLLGPVVIKAKIFLQELWKQKLDWDYELPSKLQDIWIEYKQDLSALNKLNIPRYITNLNSYQCIELHGFSDASQRAYGACMYLKTSTNTESFAALISSRTRVAPVKTVSLPRLELCGALLLAQLMKKISCSLKQPHNCYYYTDSTIVLAWIRSCPSRWTTFVSNRVASIQELSTQQLWSHVKTEENPADLTSRGLSAQDIGNNDLWWHGPTWLASVQPRVHDEIYQEDQDLPEQPMYSNLCTQLRLKAALTRYLMNIRNGQRLFGLPRSCFGLFIIAGIVILVFRERSY